MFKIFVLQDKWVNEYGSRAIKYLKSILQMKSTGYMNMDPVKYFESILQIS